MAFQDIPADLRAIEQWVLWRLEWKEGDSLHVQKATKIPYQICGWKASVNDAGTWADFDAVVAAQEANPFLGAEPCEFGTPISVAGFSGIGFVFTKNDKFAGIDLDDTHGDVELIARQKNIFEKFNSYSERSPSGRGLHIIIEADLPCGRRRGGVEIYDTGRFFTMTGDVYLNVPIAQRQDLAKILVDEMGGPVIDFKYEEQRETQTDAQIMDMARSATNQEKFCALYEGNWQNYYSAALGQQGEGRSEADLALMNIIGYYCRNKNQMLRLFMGSQLGERYKSGNMVHNSRKLDYMVTKSFDNQIPPIDTDGLRIQIEKAMAAANGGGASAELSRATDAPSGSAIVASNDAEADAEPLERSRDPSTERVFPRGLVGEIAQFIYDAAPQPVKEIALVGALGFMAGITGRAYNISGSGLSQYFILIAGTGRGKEGIKNGISRLVEAVKKTGNKVISDYEGPSKIASSQGLLKWLIDAPCCYSIVGEFGVTLRQMSAEKGTPHLVALRADLCDLYHKNGANQSFGAQAYAKKDDCAKSVPSPAFTLIGESNPLRFYENLNEETVLDGLVPRFTIFTYEGDQQPPRLGHELVSPSLSLVDKVNNVTSYASAQASQGLVVQVTMTREAKIVMDNFNTYQRNNVNNRSHITGRKLKTVEDPVQTELWNRAHIKAMRLAAVLAVGCNHFNPVIDEEQATWATNEIYLQTALLAGRFKRGEIGGGSVNMPANEASQMKFMVRKISQMMAGTASLGQYKNCEAMIADKVFPYQILIQTLQIYPAFKNDKRGASEAIRKIYMQLIDSGDVAEMGLPQMIEKYKRKLRAFVITNPDRFLEVVKEAA